MKTKYISLIIIISLTKTQITPPQYPFPYPQNNPLKRSSKNLLQNPQFLKYLLTHPKQDPRYLKQLHFLKTHKAPKSLQKILLNPLRMLKISQNPKRLKKLLIRTRKLGMADMALKAMFLPLIALAALGALSVGKQLWAAKSSPYMMIPAGLGVASLLGYFLDRMSLGQKIGNVFYPFPRNNPATKWDTDAVNNINRDLGDMAEMKDNIIFNKGQLEGLKQELNIKVANVEEMVDKCEEYLSEAEENCFKNTGDIFLNAQSIGNIINKKMKE